MKRDKNKGKSIKLEKPSAEQSLFAEAVLQIIEPTAISFGFVRYKAFVKAYSTEMVWRKGAMYLKVESTTYPTDYPYGQISLKYEQGTFSGTRSLNSKSCNPSAILKTFIADGEVSADLKWDEIPHLKLLGK